MKHNIQSFRLPSLKIWIRLWSTIAFCLVCLAVLHPTAHCEDSYDAAARVKAAIDYWRGKSSMIEGSMTIHRPDWERKTSFVSWTKGDKDSLVRFIAPPKDAGNASLTRDDEMWSFSPKVRKIIKIPSSMMNQSWMGTDFSYRDLARADDIIDDYHHKLLGTETDHGQKVYLIESVPRDSAPVVWGKEVLRIREDNIIVNHEFFDQDLILVKRLTALEIKELGGRIFPTVIRMERLDEPGKWTEVVHEKGTFDLHLPDATFTLSNLGNPRR